MTPIMQTPLYINALRAGCETGGGGGETVQDAQPNFIYPPLPKAG